MSTLTVLAQDGIPGVQGLADDIVATLTIIASLLLAIAVLSLWKQAKKGERSFWPGLGMLVALYVAFVMFINPDLIGGLGSSVASWVSSFFS